MTFRSQLMLTLLFCIGFVQISVAQTGYFRIYKDKNFSGSSYYKSISTLNDGQLYSLQNTNLHDNMSSIKWSLSSGVKVTFYEHSNGTGRKYVVSGNGSDSDTHNNNFKDCASSFRMETGPSIPKAFSQITTQGKTFRFQKNGISFPNGGHMQGIQQLDHRTLVISASSNNYAYFFIVRWNSYINSSEYGKVIKLVKINDDYPGMTDNHASGIQLVDKILAIGTEKGKTASSVVFYNLANPYNPTKVGNRIVRNGVSAGAVGIVKRATNYLLIVGGWNSDEVDFYQSNGFNLSSFSKFKTWKKSTMNTSGWIDNTWAKYQSLNLLEDLNGNLFIVGFNRSLDWDGKDWADLYSVQLNYPTSTMLKKIDKKHMYCKSGTSFRYGAGVYAPNPTSKITVWATESNYPTYPALNRF